MQVDTSSLLTYKWVLGMLLHSIIKLVSRTSETFYAIMPQISQHLQNSLKHKYRLIVASKKSYQQLIQISNLLQNKRSLDKIKFWIVRILILNYILDFNFSLGFNCNNLVPEVCSAQSSVWLRAYNIHASIRVRVWF